MRVTTISKLELVLVLELEPVLELLFILDLSIQTHLEPSKTISSKPGPFIRNFEQIDREIDREGRTDCSTVFSSFAELINRKRVLLGPSKQSRSKGVFHRTCLTQK